MAKITHVTFGVQRWLRMPIMALCILAAWPAARADDRIMNEQDINEETITNALTPAGETDRDQTLGIMHRDIHAAPEAARPIKDPSAQLLITFKSNSSKLTEGARAALSKVARALRSERLSPYKFRIEGHADPRGSANTNLKLSESRAVKVAEYLTAEGGVAADRLTPLGKGSTEPLNLQNPAAPENRRVTIVTVQD